MPGRRKSKRNRNKSSPTQKQPLSNVLKRHKTQIDSEFESGYQSDTFHTPANSDFSESDTESASINTNNNTNMCSQQELEEIITKLKSDLIHDLKAEFQLIAEAKTQSLRDEMQKLREEVDYLRKCVKTANNANADAEQYGRRMMLDISGNPGDTGDVNEDVETKILNYAKDANIDLSSTDIDKALRLGKQKSNSPVNRRVIVKFTNSKARQKIYKARKTFPNGKFVLESLTRKREQLAFEARKLKREGKLVKTWVADANIYGTLNISDEDKKISIRNMEDIEQIKEGIVPQYIYPVYPQQTLKCHCARGNDYLHSELVTIF